MVLKCNSALGIGNILTTSMTIPLKLRDSKTGQLKYRFTRLDKYFWTHRRRRNSVSQVGSLYTVFYLISHLPLLCCSIDAFIFIFLFLFLGSEKSSVR